MNENYEFFSKQTWLLNKHKGLLKTGKENSFKT